MDLLTDTLLSRTWPTRNALSSNRCLVLASDDVRERKGDTPDGRRMPTDPFG